MNLLARRWTAVSLAGTLITLSPGIAPYHAFGQMVSGAARGAAVPVGPVVPVNASISKVSLSAPGSISALPSASLSIPSAVSIKAAPAAAASAALPMSAPSARAAAAVALPRVAVQAVAKASDLKASAAVAAPETGRTEKTALGSLKSVARGAAALFGVHFDGARNGVSESEDHSDPSAQAIKALLTTMRRQLKKGEAFDRSTTETLADMAGIPHAAAEKAMAHLTRAGHVASLASGMRIFIDIPAGSEGDALHPARAAVREGLARLNESGIFAQAKAFNSLAKAVALYAEPAGKGNPAAVDERTQAEVLRLNAGLEFLRSYLFQIGSKTENGEDAANAKHVLKMVENAAFGRDWYPDPLNAYAAAWIRQTSTKYKPTQADTEAGRELGAAINALSAFADILEQKAEPALPKPAPKKAEFPLIKKDDKKFENLNKYASNLTAKAVEGRLSPLVGRSAELRQMLKTLLRVEKNNPVVIGEKGVGKTKLVEGLAQRIAAGEIPELAGVNIFKLDVTALVAGTQYRGQFEERLKGVMDEAKAHKGKVLLFIDELHSIIGLGAASGSTDASQLLKEALSSGELSLIGATTLEEYRKIEKDGALERRFNPIKLGEPTPAEAVDILEGVKGRYERKHKVTIPKATVETAVRLAARYVKSRALPDSALDLLDDASAEAELQKRSEVTPDDIAVEINLRTGIPAKDLSDDDLASLKRLPEELKSRVIGQDEAVDAVAKAIRRGRLGYREEKAPIGTFMFLGPTGVGKTEFVRVLAKNQYGSEKNIVRIDMSEYQEKHSVSRLVGAPPGYVGHESAGQLTEAVRRNPHTLVLFDEIEKAAPEVLDVLLQVIEDGRLTDGQGRVVDFSNAIIVMTSNIGGSLTSELLQPKRRIGFISDEEKAQTKGEDRTEGYIAALKAKVRPEFFNRIGKRRVIVFNELGAKELEGILDLRLAELNERVRGKGMTVRLSEGARRHILGEAASLENRPYGARPLKQAVAHEVEDALVDGELDGKIRKDDAVLVDWDGTKLTVSKDPEAKTTRLGGWGIFALSAITLSGSQLGLAMGGAILVGAGIGYVLAGAAYRHALKAYRRAHGIPEPEERFRGFDSGLIGGLLGGALAPWLWGMAPIQTAIPALTIGAVGILAVGAAWGLARVVYRAARWLARVVSRRGPPAPKSPRRFSRAAKAGIVALGLLAGVTAGVVPHGVSATFQETAASIVAPRKEVHVLPAAFRQEVVRLMEGNAEGRRILDALRDRGGVVRMPTMLMMVEDEGVGAHYLSVLDHMSIPVQDVKAKGWTVDEFLASPEKQVQLAREMAPTLAHELRHRAQYLRSIFSPGVVFGNAVEFEWEAYLSGHDFIHEALKADPHAKLDGYALYDYEEFLKDYDAYLADVEKNEIYSDNTRVGGAAFDSYFAARRADWPRHAAEGYRLLAERHQDKPWMHKFYLDKAAAVERH